MPAKEKHQLEWSVENGITASVMAIREALMEYFKGTCVERMTRSDVKMYAADRFRERSRRLYYYERLEQEIAGESVLILGNAPLYLLSRSPQIVRVHDRIVNRSPQLQAVHAGVADFLAKSLAGVKVTHHAGAKPEDLPGISWTSLKRDDSELVKNSQPLDLVRSNDGSFSTLDELVDRVYRRNIEFYRTESTAGTEWIGPEWATTSDTMSRVYWSEYTPDE